MEPSLSSPEFGRRDASHVIGGFVYQILLTIARWMDLDDSAILVCEYGEDMYEEAKAQADKSPMILLEQVKHRRRNVTLRDPDLAGALVDFVAHMNSNPSASLSFRFTTNANPSNERDFSFANGLTGIDAWRSLTEGSLSTRDRKNMLETLQTLLASYPASWFKGARKKKFELFKQLVSDREELMKFMSAVEISTGLPDHAELATEIIERLVVKGFATSAPDGQRTLHALMNSLLMRLSTETGLKILTIDELVDVASDATSMTVDAERMNSLLAFANQTLVGVKKLQSGQDELLSQVAAISDSLEKFFAFGSSTAGYSVGRPPLDPPPLQPSVRASREGLVKKCDDAFQTCTWLQLRGETGCGKTLLAASLFDPEDPHHRWVSLADKSADDMANNIERQLASWLASLSDERAWLEYVNNRLPVGRLVTLLADKLGNQGLLIVDDLPDHSTPARIVALLSYILTTFEACGSRVVTTSHTTQARLATQTGVKTLDIHVSTLDEDDIREMITSAHAPADFAIDAAVPIIQAATGSHPTLVAMAISWLAKGEWPSDISGLLDLFSEQPLERIKAESWIASTQVLNEDEKDLLARLSLTSAAFDSAIVEACAHVRPTLNLPGDIITRLRGAFLADVANDRMTVTPLLRGIGRKILPEDRQVSVHAAIASEQLKTKTVNAEDALEIATHLYQGHLYNRYALFLIQLMMEIKSRNLANALSWTAHISDPTDLLEGEATAALSLGFAAEQYRVQVLLGLNATRQLARVRERIDHTPTEGTMNQAMVLLALFGTGILLDDANPEWALESAIRGERLIRSLPGEFSYDELDIPLESATLIAVIKQRKPEQLEGLFRELKSMTPQERAGLLSPPEALECFEMAIDSSWSSELEKPQETRDWKRILKLYERIEDLANEMDETKQLVYLIARATAVTLGDYLGDVDAAIVEVSVRSGQPEIDFLLAYTQACLVADHKDASLAGDLLEEANSYGGESFGYYRVDALRRLGVAKARLREFDLSIASFLSAVQLTRESTITDLDRAEMLLELAWLYKAAGHPSRQLGCLYATAQEFENSSRDRSDARYQEAYLKAVYGMPWMWYSTCHPGSVFQNWASGIGLVPGLFTKRFVPASDYQPPLGFQNASLYLLAGLAASIHEPRLSRAALRSAITLAGEAPFASMAAPTLASVYARLGDFSDAIQLVGLFLKQAESFPKGLGRPDFRVYVWHMALAPVIVEVASGSLPAKVLANLLGAAESADSAGGRKAYWQMVSAFAESIIRAISSRTEPQEVPAELANQRQPTLLYWLAKSFSVGTSLNDAFVNQMSVVGHSFESDSLHLVPAITSLLRAFWQDVLDTRSFAINTPTLSRAQFEEIMTSSSLLQTSPRVILWAADALGLRARLSVEVSEQLKLLASWPA